MIERVGKGPPCTRKDHDIRDEGCRSGIFAVDLSRKVVTARVVATGVARIALTRVHSLPHVLANALPKDVLTLRYSL